MYIAVTVIAAMLLGVGFVLQQRAAAKLPCSYLHLRLIAELLRQRIWLGGIAVMIVGQALSAWGLGHLSLTVSEPLLATNLIFALLLAAPISGEIPRRTELVGAVLLCSGVAALSASRSVRALSESFGSFSHWPAAAIIAGFGAALAIAGRGAPQKLRATLTGAGGGLILGIADALTRRSVEIIDGHGIASLLTTWPGYAVVGTAAVGLWLVQSAFSAGPLHASLPAITAAEPIAGMTLGVLVFGDVVHITPWLLALQAAGIAAMVAGTVLVARAPMFVKLTLQPAAGHHLPTLHVTMGPSLDDEIDRAEPEPAAAGQDATAAEQTAVRPPSRRLPDVADGTAGKDQTSSAVVQTLRGVSPDAVFPGVQGTGIKALTLAGVRIPRIPRLSWLRWQRIVGIVIPRFRVQKVPPPPAAQ
ncbi:MAG TPA: DMT family transporter [Streptosporangiaceae bacterium]|jgi:drug/metabolite transporter (DMT)-like permease|nr:DMT family transporter [Streptosporangiaceae bacterium]